MTKFIKVTEVYKDGKISPIIIQTDNILSIKLSDKGKDTHVCMKDTKYYFVKESVEEIWNMLVSVPILSGMVM